MDGVLYLVVGCKHAEHQVISLFSLLRHWDGEIAILADESAEPLVRPMAKLAQVQVIRFDYEQYRRRKRRGSGAIYYAKTALHKHSPFDRTVFLDSDTVVAGDISDVFPQDDEIRITQWMDWVSTGKMMSGRIEVWREKAPTEVERMLASPWPAVNTGVIGFSRRCSRTMDAWAEMTGRYIRFICDEIAMQLVFPDWPHHILDDRFNTSPCYEGVRRKHGVTRKEIAELARYHIGSNGRVLEVVPKKTRDELLQISEKSPGPSGVRIWHGHGFKFVKKPWGRSVWWPLYREAVDANFCEIAQWTPWHSGRAGNQPWSRCKLVQYTHDPERFN